MSLLRLKCQISGFLVECAWRRLLPGVTVQLLALKIVAKVFGEVLDPVYKLYVVIGNMLDRHLNKTLVGQKVE